MIDLSCVRQSAHVSNLLTFSHCQCCSSLNSLTFKPFKRVNLSPSLPPSPSLCFPLSLSLPLFLSLSLSLSLYIYLTPRSLFFFFLFLSLAGYPFTLSLKIQERLTDIIVLQAENPVLQTGPWCQFAEAGVICLFSMRLINSFDFFPFAHMIQIYASIFT